MLYKLLNKYLGFNYIYWEDSCAQNVARVHVSADGKVWYWRYKNTKVIDIIQKPDQVLWLTCSPELYFPKNIEQTEEKNDISNH
jgi:hypothetical protein